jgi:hypothetical protein
MGVQIEDETGLILSFNNLFFDIMNSRRDCFGGLFPNPVRVDSCEFSPSVAVNDSIRIDHGYDFEDVIIIEGISFLASFDHKVEEIFDHSLNHKTGSGLYWVLPR